MSQYPISGFIHYIWYYPVGKENRKGTCDRWTDHISSVDHSIYGICYDHWRKYAKAF